MMTIETIDRRRWLGATTAGILGFSLGGSAIAWEPPEGGSDSIPIRDLDEAGLEKGLREAGVEPIHRLRSNRYLALGDAPESFLRSTLTDCEQLLIAYERHFRDHGFDVKTPDRPLLVAVFADDHSFAKYHRMSPPMREGAEVVGMYDRATNLLSVFDWRNVLLVARAANRNVQAVSHWGTHQLTCSTGLLDRRADVPACVFEGLGTYGEPRKVIGPSDLGRMNVRRADDLARLRRALPWIPVDRLLTDDATFRGGSVGKAQLAYAESWAFVHMLLNDEDRRAGFRGYLAALKTRKDAEHRLDDARTHLGDLDRLDRDLQIHVVRLVRAL